MYSQFMVVHLNRSFLLHTWVRTGKIKDDFVQNLGIWQPNAIIKPKQYIHKYPSAKLLDPKQQYRISTYRYSFAHADMLQPQNTYLWRIVLFLYFIGVIGLDVIGNKGRAGWFCLDFIKINWRRITTCRLK